MPEFAKTALAMALCLLPRLASAQAADPPPSPAEHLVVAREPLAGALERIKAAGLDLRTIRRPG